MSIEKEISDGLISTLVLAAADEVHDQDDDDQSGEGGANGNRDDVVGDLISKGGTRGGECGHVRSIANNDNL